MQGLGLSTLPKPLQQETPISAPTGFPFLVPRALSGMHYFRHNSNTSLWKHCKHTAAESPKQALRWGLTWKGEQQHQAPAAELFRSHGHGNFYQCLLLLHPCTFRMDNSVLGSDWQKLRSWRTEIQYYIYQTKGHRLHYRLIMRDWFLPQQIIKISPLTVSAPYPPF